MKEFKQLAKVSPNWEVKKRIKQLIKNGKTASIFESIGVDICYSGDRAASSGRSRRSWMDNISPPNPRCRCAQLAADMKCFVVGIQASYRESGFLDTIRFLNDRFTAERIYTSGDAKDGHRRVKHFLLLRLLRLYLNLLREERAKIEDDGQQGGISAATEDAPKEKIRVYSADL